MPDVLARLRLAGRDWPPLTSALLGESVTVEVIFTDAAGALVDATGVNATAYRPPLAGEATGTTPAIALVRVSAGLWSGALLLDRVGDWAIHAQCTGPSVAVARADLRVTLGGPEALDEPRAAASAAASAGLAVESAVGAAADRVQTGLDRTATGLDRVATAADRVQTGLDRVATGQDRAAAADSAASAAANVAPALAHAARTDNPHGTTLAQTLFTPRGAGAVARAAQDKLRETLSPADYGALVNDAATVIPVEVGTAALVDNGGGAAFSIPVGATAVEVRADGVRVTRPVNPAAAPTGGASVTQTITQQVDRLEFFDRGDVLDVTGASFDAPGLPAGYYRISASTVGTRPRSNITSGTLTMMGGSAVRLQTFVADWGETWTRRWTIVSNAATWGAWVPTAFLPRMDNGDGASSTFNFNDLTTSGVYRRNGSGTVTNPPASTLGNFSGVVLVFANDAANYVIQWAFPSGDTLSYQRTLSGGSWTAWAPLASFELRGGLLNTFDSTFKPPGIWGFNPDGQGNIPGTFPSSSVSLKTGLLMNMYRGGGAQREIALPAGLPFMFTRTNTGAGQAWSAWSSLTHGWIDNGDDRAAASFDFNTITRPGSYWRDDGAGTASNGPTGAAFQGTLEVIANTDGSYCVQRAVEWGDTTRFYQRVRTNGTWGAWRTFTGA